ncbi:MAG: aminopeptidase P N-terminal domain-containing protein [Fidelibacterota bacterium]|nr:MAG: aminopeptidase P N-terminal domain-containing protein [Candidatus Neomarinimicrobiota bacterium]
MYTTPRNISVLITRLIVPGLLILPFIGCEEKATGPDESEFPEKLAPYETFYDATTFKNKRDDLIDQIPDDAIVVVTTNDIYLRNGDVDYDFRPASTFFYLTGFEEPNAVAVIRKKGLAIDESELVMFVEERDARYIQWLGPVYGPEGVVGYFGADSAYEYGQFGSLIGSYLAGGAYQSVYANLEANQDVADAFYSAVADTPEVVSVDPIVDELRVIKSAIEISSIQKAVDVSVQAFTEAMEAIEPGMYEYEVEALFDYILRLNGCSRPAFPTMVASGANINTLHYDANQGQMSDGDLVLIDFGAEYGYYAADITRTLPVNGTYSPEQATIYEIVLEVHQTALDMAAPGVSYYGLYVFGRDMMLDRLLEKGIISGNKADILASGTFRQYIPAGLAHPVGLDPHDPFPPEESGDKILKENMVLAFEPHIYLYAGDPTVDEDYWNVSARI